jgi:hypothetical protein
VTLRHREERAMEEYVEVDDFRSGRLESIVVEQNGRLRKIEIHSSLGYPPKYAAHVDGDKVPGGPFEEKERAHQAALGYIRDHP